MFKFLKDKNKVERYRGITYMLHQKDDVFPASYYIRITTSFPGYRRLMKRMRVFKTTEYNIWGLNSFFGSEFSMHGGVSGVLRSYSRRSHYWVGCDYNHFNDLRDGTTMPTLEVLREEARKTIDTYLKQSCQATK